MKIGLISSTEICHPVLYHLASHKATVSLFYSGSSGAGNTSQLVSFCNSYQIPIVLETTKNQLYEWVSTYKPDIIFLLGYGNILDLPRLGSLTSGAFNIHFGALPNYRGP